jgi:hypothetical protein
MGEVTTNGQALTSNENPDQSVQVGDYFVLTNKMGVLGYLHLLNSFLIFLLGLIIGLSASSRKWLVTSIGVLVVFNLMLELGDWIIFPSVNPLKLVAHAAGLCVISILGWVFWRYRKALRQTQSSLRT